MKYNNGYLLFGVWMTDNPPWGIIWKIIFDWERFLFLYAFCHNWHSSSNHCFATFNFLYLPSQMSISIPNRFASLLTSKCNRLSNAIPSVGALHCNTLRNIFSFCCCTSCPNPTHSKLTSPHFSLGNHPSNCSRVCSGVLDFTHLRSLLNYCGGVEGCVCV